MMINVFTVMEIGMEKDKEGGRPVNSKIESRDIIMIFIYSAMKIIANKPLLYSVLNPDTSSDSPSAKSNGVRLVSAKEVVNQIRKIGIIIIAIHGEKFNSKGWKFINCVSSKGDMRIRAMETS